jgi:hypothetical protein
MTKTRMGWVTVITLLAGVAWMVPPAGAELFVDAYTGWNFTHDSDIDIDQPSLGNDFTFKDVAFDGATPSGALNTSGYYGVRGGYFFDTVPWFGVAIEFFHFKILAEEQDTKRLIGTVAGVSTNTTARVDSLVQQFEVTHGVSYLTVDALFRYSLFKDPERFPRGRVQLYGGFGVGPVITHAESIVGGVENNASYQIRGPGVQVFTGVRTLLFKHFGVFAEYKFTHSSFDVDIASGEGHVEENSHHIVVGITIPLPL